MVVVKSRSKSLRDTAVDTSKNTTLASILNEISRNNKNISKNRLRLTYLKESKQVPITSDAFFKETTLDSDFPLYVKDLGPQISWRLVFIIEYFGPILVHTCMWYLSRDPEFVAKWGSSSFKTSTNAELNKAAYYMILAHYLKREFESMFVHQFSMGTMPLFNLFKNSFHYWVLNGMIALGYFGYGFMLTDVQLYKIYHPLRLDKATTILGLFTFSELMNFYIHLRLRWWGDKQKKLGNVNKRVPLNEGIFTLLVAPNYTFEVWSWVWFALFFKLNFFAVLFLVVSATQMYLWAMKKNKKYGTRRAFLIPYVF